MPNNQKKHFCKRCGNILDENKKCTSCDKQYFYPIRFIKNRQAIYCKKCGSIIDQETRRCTSCKKKYIKLSRIVLFSLLSILLIATSATIVTIYLSNNNISSTKIDKKIKSDEIEIYADKTVERGSNTIIYMYGKPFTEYTLSAIYSDGTTIKLKDFKTDSTNDNLIDYRIASKINNNVGSSYRFYISLAASIGECVIKVEDDKSYNTFTINITDY